MSAEIPVEFTRSGECVVSAQILMTWWHATLFDIERDYYNAPGVNLEEEWRVTAIVRLGIRTMQQLRDELSDSCFRGRENFERD